MKPLSFIPFDADPPPIAGRKVTGSIYADRYTTIPPAQIRYAFTGGAVTLGLIDAPATTLHGLRRAHVYVRTSKGVFFVHYRSLADLLDRLGAARFLFIHHSLFVNLYQEMEPDLDGKLKLLGIPINEKELEWLAVSRRHVADLREILGLRRRRKADKKAIKTRDT